uniref:PPM-type phosphatase domain-containing protein n=1 Tax=Chromera velia CCMP2878 TaxID=1169474 RepID=A0A0G4FKW0_9ALVE|eukprot:Cvel_17538.t1-p1 / transcript=Cvel_17538.t1 / gene=Cvel_17538 / organism=Chromera_velia_CCMP2878 / gene_product=Probable protein phosphatase 2C 12, putative / transcript_product=Probable protein phosphatase 2C 12, putative / location=Cvel_scaffold1407:2105-7047(+) / protein_length=883 / sequence_SO=supercontig / SO=protein_coding / is_pseudo=false
MSKRKNLKLSFADEVGSDEDGEEVTLFRSKRPNVGASSSEMDREGGGGKVGIGELTAQRFRFESGETRSASNHNLYKTSVTSSTSKVPGDLSKYAPQISSQEGKELSRESVADSLPPFVVDPLKRSAAHANGGSADANGLSVRVLPKSQSKQTDPAKPWPSQKTGGGYYVLAGAGKKEQAVLPHAPPLSGAALNVPLSVLCGTGATIGRRPYMEDRAAVEPAFTDDLSYFAVFDGHCGAGCAEFAETYLGRLLREELRFSPLKDCAEKLQMYFVEAFERAFTRLDEAYRNEGGTAGSTAVTALLSRETKVARFAHAGDSRAVLVRRAYKRPLPPTSPSRVQQRFGERKTDVPMKGHDERDHREEGGEREGESLEWESGGFWGSLECLEDSGQVQGWPLTSDHKPNREDEKSRIEETGGIVFNWQGCWRVGLENLQSGLAVSRALGDFSFKQNGVLTCLPEVSERQLDPAQDLFLLLCSDGIFDVFDDTEVAQRFHKSFRRLLTKEIRTYRRIQQIRPGSQQRDRKTLEEAAREILRTAMSEASEVLCKNAEGAGSMDNCTCLSVLLDWGGVVERLVCRELDVSPPPALQVDRRLPQQQQHRVENSWGQARRETLRGETGSSSSSPSRSRSPDVRGRGGRPADSTSSSGGRSLWYPLQDYSSSPSPPSSPQSQQKGPSPPRSVLHVHVDLDNSRGGPRPAARSAIPMGVHGGNLLLPLHQAAAGEREREKMRQGTGMPVLRGVGGLPAVGSTSMQSGLPFLPPNGGPPLPAGGISSSSHSSLSQTGTDGVESADLPPLFSEGLWGTGAPGGGGGSAGRLERFPSAPSSSPASPTVPVPSVAASLEHPQHVDHHLEIAEKERTSKKDGGIGAAGRGGFEMMAAPT